MKTSLDKYRQWATSETERPEKPWPISKSLLTGDTSILSLTVSELCCPLFPVDPPPPKRISDDRVHFVWDVFTKLPRHPDPREVKILLNNIDEVRVIFPDVDLTYVAEAQAVARLSLFAQAEAVLEKALRICPVRSALCDAVGLTKLYQGEMVCFGWFMQACLLGYESYGPYLQLSEAAKALGMMELSNRLLNASDILSGGTIPRLRTPESTISIASESKRTLQVALETFLEFAHIFLPPIDVLPPPDSETERGQDIIIMRGWPEEQGKPILQPMRKILDRRPCA